VASENSGGGKSKVIQNANTREDRVPTPAVAKKTAAVIVQKVTPTKEPTVGPITGPTNTFIPGFSNETVVEPVVGAGKVLVSDVVPTSFITSIIYATPSTPTLQVVTALPPPPVKTATLDIILFDEESVPTDGMFDQIFENIGGQELISITRSDIVNGQKISYQPIKNLSAIQQRYNPNNILSLQQTADSFFAGFSIKLEDKIPEVGNGTNGENIYLNATGDLVIEFININPDEQVETQISVSGTIYEADLGDYTS